MAVHIWRYDAKFFFYLVWFYRNDIHHTTVSFQSQIICTSVTESCSDQLYKTRERLTSCSPRVPWHVYNHAAANALAAARAWWRRNAWCIRCPAQNSVTMVLSTFELHAPLSIHISNWLLDKCCASPIQWKSCGVDRYRGCVSRCKTAEIRRRVEVKGAVNASAVVRGYCYAGSLCIYTSHWPFEQCRAS